MTVTLQVRQIRETLYYAAGGPDSTGVGQRSLAQLGQLFHEVFYELVQADSPHNLNTVLQCAEPDRSEWETTLIDHAYRRLVGPRLRRHQAALQASSRQVLDFWKAVREACRWMAEMAWTVRATGTAPSDGSLATLISPEEPLRWELHPPDWTDSVCVTGVADAVIRIPGRPHWCVIELKLGQTAPEADLAQACLYHQMLAAQAWEDKARPPSVSDLAADRDLAGTLALVSFTPQRQERLVGGESLQPVQQQLIALIGQLAGVVRQASPPGKLSRPKGQPVTAEPAERIPTTSEHLAMGAQLVRAFGEYNVDVELAGEPIVGPRFIRYQIRLGRGVKFSAVQKRARELQIRLELDVQPMMSVADGVAVVDVQRPDPQAVPFSTIKHKLPQTDTLFGCSRVLIGVDLAGQLQFADFSQPEDAHVLVAGTTGSGKTEWLRSALAGLIATNSPDTLRLVLIDPKRNALRFLADSPFLWRPLVFPDEQDVADVLAELADEMEQRYRRMKGADTLSDHVAQSRTPLPRIICVCDEYADLVNRSRQARQAVEAQIQRLGAKARAAGIHLILATQQPSRKVVTGPVDTNMPARIGLKMANPIESRMLLGTADAAYLLGHGDLFFKDIGDPRRMQAIFLPPEERSAIIA